MMRIRSFLLIGFLAVFTTPKIQAQSNFVSGYVIDMKGDTLHGKIDYQNWDVSPSVIYFLSEKNDSVSNYFPSDIKEFGMLNEKYVSGTVQIETSPRLNDRLLSEQLLQFVVQRVFLFPLFEGEKNLYVYQDKLSNDHFYIRSDTTFNLLLYKKYLDAKNDNLSFLENKKYVGQLLYYFLDCPNLASQIQTTEYLRASITKLYTNYYKNTLKKSTFKSNQNKGKVKFGIAAGLNASTLLFTSNTWPSLVDAGYKTSYNFVPAISLEFIQGRNRNKFSSYNELLYTPYKVEGYSADDLYSYHTKMTFHYLSFITMIRYTMPLKTLKPFINGGFSFGYLLGESNYMKSQSLLFANRTYYGKALDELRRIETGTSLGLGVRNNRFTYEYRLIVGNGMSPYLRLRSHVFKNMLMVGYSF